MVGPHYPCPERRGVTKQKRASIQIRLQNRDLKLIGNLAVLIVAIDDTEEIVRDIDLGGVRFSRQLPDLHRDPQKAPA